ncbi:MAG: nucleoside-diphosphate kinase [Candidatus Aenigmatarchaeota archaeon]
MKQKRERTFVMLKPDALHRGEIGSIISRIEDSGLKIVAIDIRKPSQDLAKKHYGPEIAERHGETVRSNLVDYITEFAVIPMVVEGRNAVEKTRDLLGESFDPMDCSPGSIRGDLSSYSTEIADGEDIPIPNLVHASEDPEDARDEIDLWFDDDDIESYERPDVEYIKEKLGSNS